MASRDGVGRREHNIQYSMHRAAPVADSQTHTEEAQYLVVKGSATKPHRRSSVPSSKSLNINHTGVRRTWCHGPPSHVYGQYLVMKSRAVSYHHDWLSGGSRTHCRGTYQITPEQIMRKPITYETLNIRRPVSSNHIPQTYYGRALIPADTLQHDAGA